MSTDRDVGLDMLFGAIVCSVAALVLAAFHAHPIVTILAGAVLVTVVAVVLFRMLSHGASARFSTVKKIRIVTFSICLVFAFAIVLWFRSAHARCSSARIAAGSRRSHHAGASPYS